MNVGAQVSELIGQMREAAMRHNLRAYESASDSLETFIRAHIEPVAKEFDWDYLGITPQQRRILSLLHSRLGKETSRDSLLSAIYFDYGDRPECDRKTIDVHICRLRKELKAQMVPFRIETVWSFGFKMVEA